MRAVIYNVVKEALESLLEDGQPVIKHIDLYNRQVEFAEEEQPFLTPAVFVEFAAIDWQKQLHGVRDAVVTVRLHVVTDTRVGKWADVVPRLCLCDEINRVLHGVHAVVQGIGVEAIEQNFSVSRNTEYRQNDRPCSVMNDLTLLCSTTDHDFGELADNVEEYQCLVTDASAYERF